MARRRVTKKTPTKKSVKSAAKTKEESQPNNNMSEEEEITTLDELSNNEPKSNDNFNQFDLEENDVDMDGNDNFKLNENTNDSILNNNDDDIDNDDVKDDKAEDENDKKSKQTKESTKSSSKDSVNDKKSSKSAKNSESSSKKHSSKSSHKRENSESPSVPNKRSKNSEQSIELNGKKATSDLKDHDESYFKRMHQRSQDSFHDPTDKELFVENLIKNIDGKELKLIKYKHSSSCIIWLLENTNDTKVLDMLTDKITADQFSLDFFTNENISAVLETVIDIYFKKLSNENNWETETAKGIIKWTDSVAKFVLENMIELMENTKDTKNRIIITAFEAIGGIRIGRFWNKKNMRFSSGAKINLEKMIENDMSLKDIPPSFKHHLKKASKILVIDSSDDKIFEVMFCRYTNVAQYLLFILKVRYPELCQLVVKKLVEVVFENETRRETICQSPESAYIVEILLLVASESRLSKIWTKYIKSNLKSFWKHEISQFIIQRLLDAIKDENLYNDVLQDILPELREIFRCNRPGIGVCLTKTVVDYTKMQSQVINGLIKAFEVKDSIDLVPQMLFFEKKFHKPRKNEHYINLVWLYGSLMLQQLFKFNHTYKISKSLLSMTNNDLLRVCHDCSGSHVIDSFLQSSNVELKHKSEFVERLLGKYANLACNKYGSRILENIMELSNAQVQKTIREELIQNEDILSKDRNGWLLAKHLKLFFPKRSDWRPMDRGRLDRRGGDFKPGRFFHGRDFRDRKFGAGRGRRRF